MIFRSWAILAILPLSLSSWGVQGRTGASPLATNPIHVQTGDFNPAKVTALREAADDYQAVVAGKRPIHAVFDKHAPLPADGGTSYYIGKGYRLTIVCSLTNFSGVAEPNYLYGPIITFDQSIAPGDPSTISHVEIYSSKALHQLTNEAY